MGVLIASGATPRTVALTGGGALITALNTGRFIVPVTPTGASSSGNHNDYRAILADNAAAGGLWFATPTDAIGLYKTDGSPIFERVCTWVAGANIVIDVNMATGSCTITGCATGNGTFSFTPATSFAAGTLGIGTYTPDSFFNFTGSIGEITDGAAGVVERACSASASSAATVSAIRVVMRSVAAGAVSGSLVNGTSPTKSRSVGASATSAISTTGSRVVQRAVSATATSGASVSGTTPPAIEIGNFDWMSQLFSDGSTPARITMDVTAGSSLLLWRGGKMSDMETAPTTSVGTFTLVPGADVELADWPGYGSTLWILRNASGGTAVNIDCNVTEFDEHTVHVVEVRGGNTVIGSTFTQQANPGSPTQSSASITVVRPTLVFIDWGGAHPVGGGDHVVTATLNGVPMIDLGGHFVDDSNGYVQSRRFYLLVTSPGTYSAVVSHAPTQGASIGITGITDAKVASVSAGASTGTASAATRDVQRSVSASAVSSIVASAVRVLSRGVAASASSNASVTYLRDILRSAGLSATSGISASGAQVRSRAASAGALSGASVAFLRDVQRSAAATAVSGASVAGTRVIDRGCGVSGVSAFSTVGQREVAGVKERACGASAASSASVAYTRVVQRACIAAALGNVATRGSRIVMRGVGATGLSAMTVSGIRVSGTTPPPVAAGVELVSSLVVNATSSSLVPRETSSSLAVTLRDSSLVN